jgi:hypothetical protein
VVEWGHKMDGKCRKLAVIRALDADSAEDETDRRSGYEEGREMGGIGEIIRKRREEVEVSSSSNAAGEPQNRLIATGEEWEKK